MHVRYERAHSHACTAGAGIFEFDSSWREAHVYREAVVYMHRNAQAGVRASRRAGRQVSKQTGRRTPVGKETSHECACTGMSCIGAQCAWCTCPLVNVIFESSNFSKLHTCMHACMHKCMRACVRACSRMLCACMLAHARMHTHSNMHATRITRRELRQHCRSRTAPNS